MQSGAGDFSDGKKSTDVGATIDVCLYATTLVMSCGDNRNGVFFAIEPKVHQGFVDMGKPFLHKPFGFVGDIQINTLRASSFNFVVDSAGNDVAWGE